MKSKNSLHRHMLKVEELAMYPEPKLEWQQVCGYWRSAHDWSNAGFTPAEAREWKAATKHLPMLPPDAAAWRAAGFTPAEAADWCRNWSPAVAAERRRMGYTSRKVVTRSMSTR